MAAIPDWFISLPLIGGYIADKYWGIRRSVFWGAMMMAVGQFLMFFSASMLDTKELSHWLMYGGLTFLILGNGCFKLQFRHWSDNFMNRETESGLCLYYILYGCKCGFFLCPAGLRLLR